MPEHGSSAEHDFSPTEGAFKFGQPEARGSPETLVRDEVDGVLSKHHTRPEKRAENPCKH